jgi:hypothetical protein
MILAHGIVIYWYYSNLNIVSILLLWSLIHNDVKSVIEFTPLYFVQFAIFMKEARIPRSVNGDEWRFYIPVCESCRVFVRP